MYSHVGPWRLVLLVLIAVVVVVVAVVVTVVVRTEMRRWKGT